MQDTAPSRDPKAVFEILMRENADRLMIFLRATVRDSAVVDDLFQETMLTAWRRLDGFDRNRPFGPWLRGIGARLVMAHFRKTKRDFMLIDQPVLERISQQMNQLDESSRYSFDESIEQLRDCIKSLPEKLGTAISARYLNDHSMLQAAGQLGISQEATKKRLQRARTQLLECLQRKEVLAREIA